MSPSRRPEEYAVEMDYSVSGDAARQRPIEPPKVELKITLVAGRPTRITTSVSVPEDLTMRCIDHLINTNRYIVEGQI